MSRHRFIPDLRSIFAFVKDGRADWKPKALIVLAVVYLIWPLDLFPDFAPFIGWLDDLGLIGVALGYLGHATNKYLETKD